MQQRPFPSVRFGDVHAPHRSWAVLPGSQLVVDLRQEIRDAALLDHRQAHPIDAASASIAPHSLPRFFQHVTPEDPVVQRVEAPLSVLLGSSEKTALEVSYFVVGGVGRTGRHALARPSVARRGQSRAPSLGASCGLVLHRYCGPLGLPSGTGPFRSRLIGRGSARRGRPGRVSPVPCRAFVTCPPPYPGSVLHPSGSPGRSLLPSPRHDRLGRSALSGVHVSGLQGSRSMRWARDVAPLPGSLRIPEGS